MRRIHQPDNPVVHIARQLRRQMRRPKPRPKTSAPPAPPATPHHHPPHSRLRHINPRIPIPLLARITPSHKSSSAPASHGSSAKESPRTAPNKAQTATRDTCTVTVSPSNHPADSGIPRCGQRSRIANTLPILLPPQQQRNPQQHRRRRLPRAAAPPPASPDTNPQRSAPQAAHALDSHAHPSATTPPEVDHIMPRHLSLSDAKQNISHLRRTRHVFRIRLSVSSALSSEPRISHCPVTPAPTRPPQPPHPPRSLARSSTPASPSSLLRCSTTPTPSTPKSPARCSSATTGSRSTPTASATSKKPRSSTGRWPPASASSASAPSPPASPSRPHRPRPRLHPRSLRPPSLQQPAPSQASTPRLILLSSFGIFIFTRITIPDAVVCLWLTLALYCYWLTEQSTQATTTHSSAMLFAACLRPQRPHQRPHRHRLPHRHRPRPPPPDPRHPASQSSTRIHQLHPISSTAVFLAIAAPWHILIALANPTQGHPGNLTFTHGHWQVPLPTDGNVHGWLWFYFVNEHLLRYLNLRVPRDYDTVPLYLFWGLLLIWLMPWSAPISSKACRTRPSPAEFHPPTRSTIRLTTQESTRLLLGLWAAIPLLFFSLSTRQEYYVLPPSPRSLLLIAAWLNDEATRSRILHRSQPLSPGQASESPSSFSSSAPSQHSPPPSSPSTPPHPHPTPTSPPSSTRTPSDYALSFGHFLDLNAQAMSAFRNPLLITAIALFIGTLANWLLRRNYKPHAANLWLFAADLRLPPRRPPRPADLLPCPHLAPARRRHRPATSNPPTSSSSTANTKPPAPSASTSTAPMPTPNPSTSSKAAAPISGTAASSPTPHRIFEDPVSLSLKWTEPRRIFLWQDLEPTHLPPSPATSTSSPKAEAKRSSATSPIPIERWQPSILLTQIVLSYGDKQEN